jgi:succinate-semialdehyde dehydrogenase/glutarate-semialdehyde dehydrogenase
VAALVEIQADQHERRVPSHGHIVLPQPRGLAVALTPWNFPVSIPARKIAPALAAGCGVLFKPSEIATLSSMVLAAVLDEVLPQGLVATVSGTPHNVVDVWTSSPHVGVLSFTGSTRVGGLVAAATGARFLPTVLELGGCAPFIVLEDADPALAVDTLMVAKFRNNGQSCIAANQVMVARRVSHAFDEGTDVGPMAPAADPTRLGALVASATGSGARAVSSGAGLPTAGHFFAPTLLLDVPPDSPALSQEVFGPLAAVHVYDDLEDALALHRSTGYGLAGYVCGADLDRATAVGRRLHAGVVGVNTGTPNHPAVPFGGVGLSGIGYEGGRQGLGAFQAFQALAVGGL